MKATSQWAVCIIVLMTAATGTIASAQSDEAKMPITSMAVSGDNIFAGTRTNGVYRSTDGGKVWAPVNNGLPDKAQIMEMAATAKSVFTIVYRPERIMFVSGDNGMNWKMVSASPTNPSVTGVASFKNKVFAATPTGLYESTDDGAHWLPVKGVNEEKMTSVIASGKCVLAWYQKGRSENIFYSSTDGNEWNKLEAQSVWPDDLEVHGNNFLVTFCQDSRSIGNQPTCRAYILWLLDKKAKKWEQLDFRARYFGFDGDKIYAIKVKVSENRKKQPVYEREVTVSDDRGKSWNTVDEKTDPFITGNYGMQEKLNELDMLKDAEIGEIVQYRTMIINNQKHRDSTLAAIQKKQKEMEYKSYYSPSSNNGSKQPDYRALSQDRYNARHNTSSYIDSKGGIHIR
ncbi:MAG: BNR/Asp-box repeat protein [Flavipsychrobacter sp.]|jgi:hypothetical protein|nr:BNR/Asp-box repeat protein [Flavipsychrobacter sp.]